MTKYKLHTPYSPHSLGKLTACLQCGSEDKQVEDGECVCMGCGRSSKDTGSSLWIDVTRVYITPPYSYNRRAHFREFFLGYQGKCARAPYAVLDQLQLARKPALTKLHFQAVLKMSVRGQLKSEYIHALYYRFFECSPPNLLCWCQRVMGMCEELFACLAGTRDTSASIVSNQFLLYQILNNLGVNTSWDDVLLTEGPYQSSRAVCERSMSSLGWILF